MVVRWAGGGEQSDRKRKFEPREEGPVSEEDQRQVMPAVGCFCFVLYRFLALFASVLRHLRPAIRHLCPLPALRLPRHGPAEVHTAGRGHPTGWGFNRWLTLRFC